MNCWQYSIRELLIVTSALAIWLWIVTSIASDAPWPGRVFLAISMTLSLCSLAAVIHGIFRRFDLSWPATALWAGIVLALALQVHAVLN